MNVIQSLTNKLLLSLLILGCSTQIIQATTIQLCISNDADSEATPPITPQWAGWIPGKHFFSTCPEGEKRSAIIHVPESVKGKKAPLVINLHALGANAKLQQFLSKFDDTANENGFIVVYPEGFSKARVLTPLSAPDGAPLYTWNAGGCCSDKPINDIIFFRKLIAYVKSIYKIDEERIYATGMSNGGFMVNRVACEMSDIIAAAAPVAGPLMERFYGTKHPLGWDQDPFTCKPDNTVPLLHIHSSKDNIVPFKGSATVLNDDATLEIPFLDNPVKFWNAALNLSFLFVDKGLNLFGKQTPRFPTVDKTLNQIIGKEMGFPRVEDSIKKWCEINGANYSSGIVSMESTFTNCTQYTGDTDSSAIVELCVINSTEPLETGHCWPGPEGFGNCKNDDDVNNTYIWEFFKKHTRTTAPPGESDSRTTETPGGSVSVGAGGEFS